MSMSIRGGARRATASCLTKDAQPEVLMSRHARRRSAQRHLTEDNVRYIMAYGREYRRTGVTFIVLRRRDIPRDDLRRPALAHLQGAVLLIGDEGIVITLYRNPCAARTITRKLKYRQRWGSAQIRPLPEIYGDESESYVS